MKKIIKFIKTAYNNIKKYIKKIFRNKRKERKEKEEKAKVESKENINKITIMFNKNISTSNCNIEYINSLTTSQDIKDILCKYEKSQIELYKKYIDIINKPEFFNIIKNQLLNLYKTLNNETNFKKYNEAIVNESIALSKLYKLNNFDRTVIDLYNILVDYIDESRENINQNRLEFKKLNSNFELVLYKNFIEKQVYLLEELKLDECINNELINFENLSLIHLPKYNENFTVYRDEKNMIEYTRFNNKWQISR